MTQSERILELLRLRGPRGLTALEALNAGAGMRLAARIADLKAAGHVITSETITTDSGARVARYVLLWPRPVEGKRITWDEMRERVAEQEATR